MVRSCLALLLWWVASLSWLGAAEALPWALGDPAHDHVEGTSTRRAFAELALHAPAQPIIVAVIDSGLDTSHPDLRERLWTDSTTHAGIGGALARHGWNFIGSATGKQVTLAQLEVARELARLKALAATQALSPQDQELLQKIDADYQQQLAEWSTHLGQVLATTAIAGEIASALEQQGLTELTPTALAKFQPTTPSGSVLKMMLQGIDPEGTPVTKLREQLSGMQRVFDTEYSLTFDESAIIGDHPDQLDEHDYGNAIVAVPETDEHGTLVAGVIGAQRDERLGVEGQCPWVRIMAVRAVPEGDERDKDVANAIRWAVDHHARIINCSFGKPYSPHKEAVDAAVRYAAAHDVLIVHAAGNDGKDLDHGDFFPNPFPRHPLHPGERFENWIEVGASSKDRERLAAPFSNYGAQDVDLFAPGVRIRSTAPDGKAEVADGTSLAAPEVSGVAALVWSQHPELTAAQLRKALCAHARTYPGLLVPQPGSHDTVPFASLSSTGGVVDAYATLVALDPHAARVKDSASPSVPQPAPAPGSR